jgi:hypothetical protein
MRGDDGRIRTPAPSTKIHLYSAGLPMSDRFAKTSSQEQCSSAVCPRGCTMMVLGTGIAHKPGPLCIVVPPFPDRSDDGGRRPRYRVLSSGWSRFPVDGEGPAIRYTGEHYVCPGTSCGAVSASLGSNITAGGDVFLSQTSVPAWGAARLTGLLEA